MRADSFECQIFHHSLVLTFSVSLVCRTLLQMPLLCHVNPQVHGWVQEWVSCLTARLPPHARAVLARGFAAARQPDTTVVLGVSLALVGALYAGAMVRNKQLARALHTKERDMAQLVMKVRFLPVFSHCCAILRGQACLQSMLYAAIHLGDEIAILGWCSCHCEYSGLQVYTASAFGGVACTGLQPAGHAAVLQADSDRAPHLHHLLLLICGGRHCSCVDVHHSFSCCLPLL